jgi:hypothetical protein
MKRVAHFMVPILIILHMGILFPGVPASAALPQRFFLDFPDAYLIYVPKSGVLQIVTVGSVLSYGSDWEIKKLKPYLYHMRLKTWKGFFWKVNTSRKKVWSVTGGTFGQLGGKDKEKKFTVDVVGGGKAGTPDRFLIRFPKAYLVYVPANGTLQIAAGGNVLSYRANWEVKQLKSYLYHMQLTTWQKFFWKINTSRKQIWRVENGTFGELGGTNTELKITVRVVE